MIQVAVFWVVTPCSYVVGYQCFVEQCCLRNIGVLSQHYTMSQTRKQTRIFIKNSNRCDEICTWFMLPAFYILFLMKIIKVLF